MQRTQTLLAALFLGIAFATHSGATVYPSDGSEANVQVGKEHQTATNYVARWNIYLEYRG